MSSSVRKPDSRHPSCGNSTLVALLRHHLDEYGTRPGRLFHAARGGRVRSTEYTEV
jgi:hypothetical protein